MKSNSWSDLIRQVENQGVVVDEHLMQRIQEENSIKYVFLKVVALLGSLLAMGFFFGFLFLTLGDSLGYVSFTIFGVLLYALSFLGNKKREPALRDGVFVATYISAFVCLMAAYFDFNSSERTMEYCIVLLSLLGFSVFKSKIIQFISVLSLYYGLVYLMGTLNLGYLGLALFWFVVAGVYVLFIKEVKLKTATNFWSQKYSALQHGLIALLFLEVVHDNIALIDPSSWINSNRSITYNEVGHQIYFVFVRLVLVGLTYFTVTQIGKKHGFKQLKLVIGGSIVGVLALSSFMNGFGIPLTVSLLLIVWSFQYRLTKGIVLGVVLLLFSLVSYYYFLQVSLLIKSLLLMGCGLVFLSLFIINNRWNREK
ncbi:MULTISPECIES: DUF4401 domain-containing protein [unclassified Myroides]|uniref:DUF4401 domain-containing protein n=1 Tax=unclassified Myroides TaxID=2642485 RepID=UPI003D2F6384